MQGPDVVEEVDLVDMAIDNELHRQKILQSVDEQPCMLPFGESFFSSRNIVLVHTELLKLLLVIGICR